MPKTPKESKSPSPEWARPIRELRQELGLNQPELGLRVHYSAMTISRWERGESKPSIVSLYRVAVYFERPMEYFVQDDPT